MAAKHAHVTNVSLKLVLLKLHDLLQEKDIYLHKHTNQKVCFYSLCWKTNRNIRFFNWRLLALSGQGWEQMIIQPQTPPFSQETDNTKQNPGGKPVKQQPWLLSLFAASERPTAAACNPCHSRWNSGHRLSCWRVLLLQCDLAGHPVAACSHSSATSCTPAVLSPPHCEEFVAPKVLIHLHECLTDYEPWRSA